MHDSLSARRWVIFTPVADGCQGATSQLHSGNCNIDPSALARAGRATASAGRAPVQRALHVPLAQAVAHAVHVVAVALLAHADRRPDHPWLA
eukprot:12739089-Alexandrium_andersonii.AAC.1